MSDDDSDSNSNNSSSSDDWSSSSSSSDEEDQNDSRISSKQKQEDEEDSDDSSGDGHSETDDGDNESDSEQDEANERTQRLVPKEKVANDRHLSLGERLSQREEANQPVFQHSNERKAKARQIVSELLAKQKEGKKQDGKESRDTDGKILKKRKRSKHAPTEVSSKRKDFYNRRVDLNESGIGIEIGAHRYKPRDPRASSLSGHLDEDHFERNYAFVDDVRDQEMKDLKSRIEARKMTGSKGNRKRRQLGLTAQQGQGSLEKDVQKLRELQQIKADMERKKIDRNAKRAVKKKLQEEVETGKRSNKHFLKRREMKQLYTEAKFDEIQKRGGDRAVEKALSKRRKKNKSRDARGFGV